MTMDRESHVAIRDYIDASKHYAEASMPASPSWPTDQGARRRRAAFRAAVVGVW